MGTIIKKWLDKNHDVADLVNGGYATEAAYIMEGCEEVFCVVAFDKVMIWHYDCGQLVGISEKNDY